MFGLARERSRPPVACRQRSPRLPTSETTMMSLSHASTRAALALVLASVSWSAGAAAQGPRSALDPITSAVISHPITTSSAEARAHFLEGLRAFDPARPRPATGRDVSPEPARLARPRRRAGSPEPERRREGIDDEGPRALPEAVCGACYHGQQLHLR